MFVHIVEEELCCSFSGDRLVARGQNYLLCKAMVYHNCVISMRFGQISDEVHQYLGKGSAGWGSLDRHQGRIGQVSVNLGLLADSTSISVVLDKGVHSWPPIIILYQVHHSQVPQVAHRQGIMVLGYHISSKFLIVRHVASIFVEHKVVISSPVRQC